MQINIDDIIQYLESKEIVSKIIEVISDEAANRGYYKIRCNLFPHDFKIQIKWVDTPNDFIYSYQLFTDIHLLRWDNSPHYPKIKTFPHHFHDIDEKVHTSEITGIDIKADLDFVLNEISGFIDSELEL